MKIDVSAVRKSLKSFDFKTLFLEHLGWDNHQVQLDIPVDGVTVRLTAVAQKHGFTAFVCLATIPDRPARLKIDHKVTKFAREHFVIYADQSAGRQVWHWVRRQPGQPLASRDHRFDASQTGDSLIQRLDQITVSLVEEEDLTVVDVAGRARAAFDVDKVTKKFYDRFKAEHAAFLKLISGIKTEADRQWYTSLMLNRLMFVYFIQKKGFLDNDTDYLRHRLATVRQVQGQDKFQSFYRYFLLRLFHDGLGKSPDARKLDPVLERLLGKVPFLDGGFFEVHQLEEQNPDLDIPDRAFERLFDFFEQYRWHLDERPLRADNEINPDVVGYIFEKYVNQKQMGAYYTKEDITEYISKNTIIPFLFDAVEKKCPIAFKPDSFLWKLLREEPERYLYPAVKHGVIREDGSLVPETELPDFVQTGRRDPRARMHDKRYNLQQAPAGDPLRLVTETWREYIYRRTRCLDIREKLGKGEVHRINDLITLNLNIWQFARDAIVTSEGPELLRAFWQAIAGKIPEKSTEKFETGITVLDPTCGSGAFLFAALRILETLYSDCLERMERFVEDLAGKPHHPEKFSDFKKVLARIAEHPSERYFILKSIIINNLFGVDIMEEAVEICKLRLFLKLVAQVEKVEQIEPLPDLDFNIRAGNTLVGYTTADQVRKAFTEKAAGKQTQVNLMFGETADDYRRFEEDVEMVERGFRQFRAQQTTHGGKVTPEDKRELRQRLEKLDAELDRFLAGDYGVVESSFQSKEAYENAFAKWKDSHQPFHWFVEFYGIMRDGGFDVIIGNPPYVIYNRFLVGYTILLDQFKTHSAKNLYVFVFERAISLAKKQSPVSLIVQLTAMSSERLPSLQNLLAQRGFLISASFPRRPEAVFEGVEMPVAILLSFEGPTKGFETTRINRFYTRERQTATELLCLVRHAVRLHDHRIAKFGNFVDISIYSKISKPTSTIDSLTDEGGEGILYYQEACRYWLKAFDQLPFFTRNGKRMEPPHGRVIRFMSPNAASFVACLLNSSLFYWYYSSFSDCEHVNDVLLRTFKLPERILCDEWRGMTVNLMKRLEETASRKSIKTKQGHMIVYDEMKAVYAKDILDEIDRVLAQHYGFTDEELDFIINYDIKYRMGRDGDAEEE
ncbi:MAG: DNA methyltransferase [Thermodesulfobacteriota bacterium]